jgi:nitroreductase
MRRTGLEPEPGVDCHPAQMGAESAVHPLLAARASPVAFDASHEVSDGDVASLLEAARWAPSAGNSQPWAFIVARRGAQTHTRITRHLAASASRWAPDASMLVGNVSHRYVEDTDWEYSEFSLYDLGQAVAHMTIQAQALGLAARQFRAFDQAALHLEFAIPDHWQLSTITAFGLPASEAAAAPVSAGGARPLRTARQRRSQADLLWPPAPPP